MDKELSSLQYTSVDTVVEYIVCTGPGTQLAKVDIRQAYRNVPVHPSDRHLLGMQWKGKGKAFINKTIPFGLRSVLKLFTALADALKWILHRRGVE